MKKSCNLSHSTMILKLVDHNSQADYDSEVGGLIKSVVIIPACKVVICDCNCKLVAPWVFFLMTHSSTRGLFFQSSSSSSSLPPARTEALWRAHPTDFRLPMLNRALAVIGVRRMDSSFDGLGVTPGPTPRFSVSSNVVDNLERDLLFPTMNSKIIYTAQYIYRVVHIPCALLHAVVAKK